MKHMFFFPWEIWELEYQILPLPAQPGAFHFVDARCIRSVSHTCLSLQVCFCAPNTLVFLLSAHEMVGSMNLLNLLMCGGVPLITQSQGSYTLSMRCADYFQLVILG